MIARAGAIILAIIVLSFITSLLLMSFITPYGFGSGSSLASFFNFLSGNLENECDCEFSSQLQEQICNPFCGELSGSACKQREDCLS